MADVMVNDDRSRQYALLHLNERVKLARATTSVPSRAPTSLFAGQSLALSCACAIIHQLDADSERVLCDKDEDSEPGL